MNSFYTATFNGTSMRAFGGSCHEANVQRAAFNGTSMRAIGGEVTIGQ